MISLRSMRGAAAGAVGAGAVAGAMLFGGIPAAQAAPAPAPTSFDTAGPHGGAPLSPGLLPERPGWGHGGGGHGGWGHGGWGHGGGWGRGWGNGGGWGHGWGGGHGWGNGWRPWW
jgi:hypothetical protein